MKNRFHTFLYHILISALIAIISAIIVFFFWCPAPLDEAIGVRKIFLLVLLVNMILGPMATFITYKQEPAFLKIDLPIIAVCQLIMLSYGMYAVFQGRPAFIVYSNASFTVVRPVDLQPKSLLKARQTNNITAIAEWTKPKWVATLPTSEPMSDFVISADKFRPLAQAKTLLLADAKTLSELRALYKNQPDSAKLNEWQENDVKWLPLDAPAKNMVVVINSHSAEVLKILDVNPYPQ